MAFVIPDYLTGRTWQYEQVRIYMHEIAWLWMGVVENTG